MTSSSVIIPIICWPLKNQSPFLLNAPYAGQVVEVRKRLLGPTHKETIEAMQYLAIVFHCEDRYDESEAVELKALQIRKQVWGPDHPDTIDAIGNLASTWYFQERYSKAETAQQ